MIVRHRGPIRRVSAERPLQTRLSSWRVPQLAAFHRRFGAIACVEHVIDIGLVTDETKDWLAMLLESPLVGAARVLAQKGESNS